MQISDPPLFLGFGFPTLLFLGFEFPTPPPTSDPKYTTFVQFVQNAQNTDNDTKEVSQPVYPLFRFEQIPYF